MSVDIPYKTISSAFCQKYAESLRDNCNEVSILSETIDYLGEAFQTTNKFLKKNNVPIVAVIGRVALEQKIEPHDFHLFINAFANNLFPSYDKASRSGNVKAKQVQMRLRVMFLAFCKHFGLNAEEVRSPFSEEIDLYEGIVPEDAPLSEEASDSEETDGLVLPDIFSEDENAQTEEEPLSSAGSDADDSENLPEAGETHEEG